METIVQWATILSPLIAVLLAWWTGRCSAKETVKKIDALEQSTTRQVESIKQLAKQQMDAVIYQVELEIRKNQFFAKQTQQELNGINEINHSGLSHIVDWKTGVMQQFMEKKPERDYKLYISFINDLEGIKNKLVANKIKLD